MTPYLGEKMKTFHHPFLPFRDQIWKIQFEDGRMPAYISVYNEELTGSTENAPEKLKRFGANFHPWTIEPLSAQGMAFYYMGINE